MNSHKAAGMGVAGAQLKQYDNFDASMSPRDTQDDYDYDDSKGDALGEQQETDP